MFNIIDTFLNKITMYRLVLYFLIVLCILAAFFGAFGLIPYTPLAIITSVLFITVVCWITNRLFAYTFEVPANIESVYITALILALIISPFRTDSYAAYFSLATWASVWAMASKYIFAIKRKHIFNPAAFAVALTSLTLAQSATWWIGNAAMSFFVLVLGALIVRKIRRSDLVWSFLITALLCIVGSSLLRGSAQFSEIIIVLQRAFLYSPLFFFAFVMLTEPLTTPPTRKLRILYGILVGICFVPSFHIGGFYFTPEIALLIGNIFVYMVSPKIKLLLTLTKKIQVADNVFDFWFSSKEKLKFLPGQYLEWTLAPQKSDSRGNRRYFTISSSPTEEGISMGIKFYEPASAFKQHLQNLIPGQTIIASQLAGDFILPKDSSKKLVFISGGIGVTPFRSMIKYIVDKNEKRSIIHFYLNKKEQDIAYREVFDEAKEKSGITTIYSLGRITGEDIKNHVPDYQERIFYLSGPQAMVKNFEYILRELGLPKRQIKTDYFPGFA